jgi:Tol biopolymer transport system component
VPTISSISPASAVAGGQGFTLTINGTNFVSGATVVWNGGNSKTATFVSSTQVTTMIAASDIAQAGTVTVSVLNPLQGQPSNTVNYLVNNPKATIASLSPSSAMAGAAPLTLTVNGSSFFSGATVQWNGSMRKTTFVNASQLTAAIPASDVSTQGTAQVTVINPTPNLGPSTATGFTINPLTSNPVPNIGSLSDTSAPVGWPGFPLTINGAGFVEATTGQWNGLNRTTNVLSSAQLQSAIPLGDLATTGAAQVNAFTGSPGGGTSNVVNFTIKSVTPGAIGVIERSSIATDLTESNGNSTGPATSADGRFVVFVSDADNLVKGDTNGATDAFLRDTCLGAPAGCVPSVVRVSVASNGAEANGGSSDAAISANGRYVAFTSQAGNLVPGITAGNSNVFLRDTCFGASGSCTPGATMASLGLNNDSFGPALSADGRYITFTNGSPKSCGYYAPYTCTPANFLAMIHDTCAGVASGCTASTTVVSLANDGSNPDDTTADPQALISANGRFVVFRSAGTNLVADGGGAGIFLRDTCKGASGCKPSTIRVSIGGSGSIPANDLFEFALSGNGRFVAFTSSATNVLQGDTNGSLDVFVRDTCFGAPAGCKPSTSRVSLANDGSQATGDSHVASISDDGRVVAFTSAATNLVANDSSPFPKIFIRDTCAGTTSGCTASTIRLSVALNGTAANNQSVNAAVSANGAYVAFASLASNLGPGDTNQAFDVFVARTGLP